MKDIAKLGLVLCLVSTIAALALAMTHQKTFPLIQENKRKVAEAAYQEVLPLAVEFIPVSVPVTSPGNILLAERLGLSDGKQADSGITLSFSIGGILGLEKEFEPMGVAFSIAPAGYCGNITMVVGFDLSGNVSGIKIIDHKETPGLGSKMTEVNVEKATRIQGDNPRVEVRKPWYQEQFKGRTVHELFLKVDAAGGRVPERVEGIESEMATVITPSGTLDSITAATISSRSASAGVRDAGVLWLNLKKTVLETLSRELGTLSREPGTLSREPGKHQ